MPFWCVLAIRASTIASAILRVNQDSNFGTLSLKMNIFFLHYPRHELRSWYLGKTRCVNELIENFGYYRRQAGDCGIKCGL
jgi:hypothetical protein